MNSRQSNIKKITGILAFSLISGCGMNQLTSNQPAKVYTVRDQSSSSICARATKRLPNGHTVWIEDKNWLHYVAEAKRRSLTCATNLLVDVGGQREARAASDIEVCEKGTFINSQGQRQSLGLSNRWAGQVAQRGIDCNSQLSAFRKQLENPSNGSSLVTNAPVNRGSGITSLSQSDLTKSKGIATYQTNQAKNDVSDAPSLVNKADVPDSVDQLYHGFYQKCGNGRSENTEENVVDQFMCFESSLLQWLNEISGWRDARARGEPINTNLSEPLFMSERLRYAVVSGTVSPMRARHEFVLQLNAHQGTYEIIEERLNAKAKQERGQEHEQKMQGIFQALIGFGIASGRIPLPNGNSALTPYKSPTMGRKNLVRSYNDGVNRMCTYCCNGGYNFTVTYRANQICPDTQ